MLEGRVCPLRDLVYVERVRQETSEGGIVLIQDYKARRGKRLTMQAQPDMWRGRVLAVGPKVPDLLEGHEVLVYNWADDPGQQLFTGVSAGEKDRVFVRYPDDLVCALE
jgi:co-chaperonin GroES (HSP10)